MPPLGATSSLSLRDTDGDIIEFRLSSSGKLQEFVNGKLELAEVRKLRYRARGSLIQDDNSEFNLRAEDCTYKAAALHALAAVAGVWWSGDELAPICELCLVDVEGDALTFRISKETGKLEGYINGILSNTRIQRLQYASDTGTVTLDMNRQGVFRIKPHERLEKALLLQDLCGRAGVAWWGDEPLCAKRHMTPAFRWPPPGCQTACTWASPACLSTCSRRIGAARISCHGSVELVQVQRSAAACKRDDEVLSAPHRENDAPKQQQQEQQLAQEQQPDPEDDETKGRAAEKGSAHSTVNMTDASAILEALEEGRHEAGTLPQQSPLENGALEEHFLEEDIQQQMLEEGRRHEVLDMQLDYDVRQEKVVEEGQYNVSHMAVDSFHWVQRLCACEPQGRPWREEEVRTGASELRSRVGFLHLEEDSIEKGFGRQEPHLNSQVRCWSRPRDEVYHQEGQHEDTLKADHISACLQENAPHIEDEAIPGCLQEKVPHMEDEAIAAYLQENVPQMVDEAIARLVEEVLHAEDEASPACLQEKAPHTEDEAPPQQHLLAEVDYKSSLVNDAHLAELLGDGAKEEVMEGEWMQEVMEQLEQMGELAELAEPAELEGPLDGEKEMHEAGESKCKMEKAKSLAAEESIEKLRSPRWLYVENSDCDGTAEYSQAIREELQLNCADGWELLTARLNMATLPDEVEWFVLSEGHNDDEDGQVHESEVFPVDGNEGASVGSHLQALAAL